jgi:hypothetical protein
VKKYYLAVGILVAVIAVVGIANADDNDDRPRKFEAFLSGAQEILPPPAPVCSGLDNPPCGFETDTTARFTLRVNRDLSEAHFRLVVHNGVGIRQAHLHCGRPGENGPIVVFLFPPAPPQLAPPGINVDGVLAEGTLTNADFTEVTATPDCVEAIGRSVNNLASLAVAARDGLIYANVHTVAHGSGEARGQLFED